MDLENIGFGVGAAKTGSHSLAGLFASAIKVAHEPDSERFLALVLQFERGELSGAELQRSVKALLIAQGAQLNVAAMNGYLIRTVFSAFPSARYILTVRDAGSWVRSFVNHQVTRSPAPTSGWHAFRELRFVRDCRPHRPEELPLLQRGIYSLDAYLGYWAKHNLTVIETIPGPQLCIVATHHLARDAKRLSRFIGVRPGAVALERSHQFKGDYRKPSPLDDISPKYLAERVAAYTRTLLELSARTLGDEHINILREALAYPS